MERSRIREFLPMEIEARSFEIIGEELGDIVLDRYELPIIKRVIHTSADFDYLENLKFGNDAVVSAGRAIEEGVTFVTDTNMAYSGISKPALRKLNCSAVCYMADEDVAEAAKRNGTTRAVASMEKAAALEGNVIFAIGNAPTALIALYDMIKEGRIKPSMIIGVPVGFVNVVEAKELIMSLDVPYIVAQGRKGGSNVAAAVCNALLYEAGGR